MNRFFTLLLCAAMLLSLTACGASNAPAPTDATASATIPATAPTAAPTDAPTEPAAADTVTLVDNARFCVQIVGIEHSEHAAMQLKLQCVNKTDRGLLFSWDMVSVCGYMYDPLWATEVAAGKTALSFVELDTHRLEEMGIPSVDEITFTLRVADAENFMDAPLLEEVFTVYPTGLGEDTLVLPQRITSDTDVTVVDNDHVRFLIEGTEDASFYKLKVYLENKTDRNLMFAWDHVSVNDFMVDPFWATSVAAGKKACSEITFSRADLENSGISEVENIEFTLQVSDYDDWSADYLLKETYVYNP